MKKNYLDYLRIKDAVTKEDATINWVQEQFSCSHWLARCIVKDWKTSSEQEVE